jgi:acyl-CoA synthetase (AMP-forming)/AMP-acid ligase II
MTTAIPLDPAKVFAAAARLVVEDPMFAVGEAEIRGQTYRIFKNAPPSLVGVFQFAASHGDRPFLHYEGESLTFRQTWADASALAAGLKSKFGIGKGSRVAIAMRNYPEWCVAYMAIISLGAVAVPLNAWWRSDELRYGLKDCGARLVILDGKRLDFILPHKEELGLTLVLARDRAAGADHRYEDVLAAGRGAPAPVADIAPDDDFSIVYTSGSTGAPKGVILTHRGALTTLFSWAFVAAAIKEARGGVSLFGDDPGVLLAVPLFHVTGSHSLFMMSMLIGRRVVIMPKWAPARAVDLINEHKLTNFVGVPSQSFELIGAAEGRAMPTLLDIGSGGAKRPPDHVARLKESFPNANPASGYGLSETNALGCVISLDDYQKRPDSTGRAVPPLCDLKIMTETGEAATGEVGEVWLRSAANFRGYLNLPEETAKSVTADGWFKTGDLGRLDDEGFLYIVDRLKDLIIRGGENISCLEVENCAYAHDDVAEVSVFSVPDEVLGERVGMVVYPRNGAIDLAGLRDFMSARIAAFKTPERIWLAPAPLPRLGTEKFDKRVIRMVALQHPPAWRA